MRATHSRDRSKPSYSQGVQLKSVESVKYLGVKINYDLSWGKHVSYIVNKANKVLGVIKRSLGKDRYAFPCLILRKSPKKSITVRVKAKARRNEL